MIAKPTRTVSSCNLRIAIAEPRTLGGAGGCGLSTPATTSSSSRCPTTPSTGSAARCACPRACPPTPSEPRAGKRTPPTSSGFRSAARRLRPRGAPGRRVRRRHRRRAAGQILRPRYPPPFRWPTVARWRAPCAAARRWRRPTQTSPGPPARWTSRSQRFQTPGAPALTGHAGEGQKASARLRSSAGSSPVSLPRPTVSRPSAWRSCSTLLASGELDRQAGPALLCDAVEDLGDEWAAGRPRRSGSPPGRGTSLTLSRSSAGRRPAPRWATLFADRGST